MKHYLYVKTITDSIKKINTDKLNSIVSELESDKITVTQRFIGYGNACFSFSENADDLQKIRNKLAELEIDSYLINDADIAEKQKQFFVPVEIEQTGNSIIFRNSRRSVTIDKGDAVVFGAGINKQRVEKPILKSYLLNDKSVFFIYSKNDNAVILMDYASVNFSKLRDASKYSRTENIMKLIEALKSTAHEFYEDYYYSRNYIPELMPELPEYAAIVSLLADRGYYRFAYSTDFYSDNDEDEQGVYDYKYNIYKPEKLAFRKNLVSELNLGMTILTPVVIAGFSLFLSKSLGIWSGVGLFGTAATLVFFFVKYLKFKMYIEDIPSANIESLSIGLHEVKGTVLDRNAIPSPITGVKSVFFRYYKFAYEHRNDKDEWNLKEIGEYIPECFYIEQNGKTLRVNTEHAVFDVQTKTHVNTPFYLMNSAYKNKDEKYAEICLPVYRDVYIMGSVTAKDNRDEFLSFLRTKKSDPAFMKRFDKDGNNQIDAEEWEEARTEIENLFTEKVSSRKQNELLQIGYEKDDKVFFISEKSEKKIIRTLNIYLAANLIFVAAMIALGSWIIWG